MTDIGYIDEYGKYHETSERQTRSSSSVHKQYDHEMQRRQFSKDIIQPHRNGKPNPDFIRAYPEYSKKYFSIEQIKQAEREL